MCYSYSIAGSVACCVCYLEQVLVRRTHESQHILDAHSYDTYRQVEYLTGLFAML